MARITPGTARECLWTQVRQLLVDRSCGVQYCPACGIDLLSNPGTLIEVFPWLDVAVLTCDCTKSRMRVHRHRVEDVLGPAQVSLVSQLGFW